MVRREVAKREWLKEHGSKVNGARPVWLRAGLERARARHRPEWVVFVCVLRFCWLLGFVSFLGVRGKASTEMVFYSVGRSLIRGRSCNLFGFLWFDLKADVGQRGKDSLGDDSASLEDHSAEFDRALLSPNLDCLHALAIRIRFNEC